MSFANINTEAAIQSFASTAVQRMSNAHRTLSGFEQLAKQPIIDSIKTSIEQLDHYVKNYDQLGCDIIERDYARFLIRSIMHVLKEKIVRVAVLSGSIDRCDEQVLSVMIKCDDYCANMDMSVMSKATIKACKARALETHRQLNALRAYCKKTNLIITSRVHELAICKRMCS